MFVFLFVDGSLAYFRFKDLWQSMWLSSQSKTDSSHLIHALSVEEEHTLGCFCPLCCFCPNALIVTNRVLLAVFCQYYGLFTWALTIFKNTMILFRGKCVSVCYIFAYFLFRIFFAYLWAPLRFEVIALFKVERWKQYTIFAGLLLIYRICHLNMGTFNCFLVKVIELNLSTHIFLQ